MFDRLRRWRAERKKRKLPNYADQTRLFAKIQELRQSSDAQIKSVLNEDQQKNFDKMREEQRGRMRQWNKGENAPPAGDSQQ